MNSENQQSTIRSIDVRQIRGVLITYNDHHVLQVRPGLAEQAVNQFFLGGAHLPLPVEKLNEDVQTLAVLLAILLEEHLSEPRRRSGQTRLKDRI